MVTKVNSWNPQSGAHGSYTFPNNVQFQPQGNALAANLLEAQNSIWTWLWILIVFAILIGVVILLWYVFQKQFDFFKTQFNAEHPNAQYGNNHRSSRKVADYGNAKSKRRSSWFDY